MKYISDGRLSIGGIQYSGVVKELTLPTMEAKTEDLSGLGRFFDIRLLHGMGVVEFTFTIIDGNIPVHGMMLDQINISISGTEMSSVGRTFSNGYTCNLTGRITNIEGGTLNRSESSSSTVTIAVDFMDWRTDTSIIATIDVENNIYETPNGDKLIDYRTL